MTVQNGSLSVAYEDIGSLLLDDSGSLPSEVRNRLSDALPDLQPHENTPDTITIEANELESHLLGKMFRRIRFFGGHIVTYSDLVSAGYDSLTGSSFRKRAQQLERLHILD